MATFAQLDSNNKVIATLKVRDEDCGGGNFPESEPIGIEYLKNHYGQDTVWKQCSINHKFRKKRPELGSTYNPELDIFILPRPFPSWIFSLETYEWEAPVPYPKTDVRHYWDESTLSWVDASLDLPPPQV